MEAWGEEIFPEGVGVKGKNGPGGGGGEGKILLFFWLYWSKKVPMGSGQLRIHIYTLPNPV